MPGILVADDDVLTLESAGGVLSDAGFEVTKATTGQAGLDLAKCRAFQLILLDLRLPDLTGIQVLQQLRFVPVEAPVVIMTGFASVPSVVEAMRLGAVDYVEKPLIGDDLVRVVLRGLAAGRCVRTKHESDDECQARARTVDATVDKTCDGGVASPRRSVDDTRVAEVLQILETEFRKTVRIGNLAQRVNLTASRLEHLFRHDLGTCITRWLRARRLSEAEYLLRTTHKRASEICYGVGFNDPSNFAKAFRRRFGETPTAYRARTRRS
jgi:YesN/AraC family two-component response regulator